MKQHNWDFTIERCDSSKKIGIRPNNKYVDLTNNHKMGKLCDKLNHKASQLKVYYSTDKIWREIAK